jgi:multisubunit Na+/H+ antiporter MnhE subunit
MAKQNPGGDAGQQSRQAVGPLAGEPRRRRTAGAVPRHRGVVTWLTWWVLLMSLWVAVDDSVAPDELLAGAGAAALAALAAAVVSRQAGTRYRIRVAWLGRAFALPGQVASDTIAVFWVLARAIFTNTAPPHGAFREVPARYGDDTPLGVTRRVLLTAARSLTPNAFVVDFDAKRDVMLVHELVVRQ